MYTVHFSYMYTGVHSSNLKPRSHAETNTHTNTHASKMKREVKLQGMLWNKQRKDLTCVVMTDVESMSLGLDDFK